MGIVCGITFLVALGIRTIGLGEKALWLDETGTLSHIRSESVGALLDQVRTYETGKGPLYFLGLRTWVGLFGESEVALRTPSAIMGAFACVLAVVWVALLSRHLETSNPNGRPGVLRPTILAAVAGAFTALHPTLIVLSREARTYALSHLFLMGAAVLAVPAYLGPHTRWTAILRFACPCVAAVGASAHLFSSIFLAGVFAATASVFRVRREGLAPLGFGALLFLVIMLTQAPATLGHLRTTYLVGEALPTIGLRDVASYVLSVGGGKPGVACSILLVVVSLWKGQTSPLVRFGVIATVVGGVLAALAELMVPSLPFGGARYLAWSAFFVPLLLAGIAETRGKWPACLLAALIASLGTSVAWRAEFERRYTEDWRAVAESIASQDPRVVEVLCHRGHIALPLTHYYRETSTVHPCPFVGLASAPCTCVSTAREALSRGRRVLLVWSHAEPWESRRAEFEAALGPSEVIHEQYAIRVLRFGR